MIQTPARAHEMSLEHARIAARKAASAHLKMLNEQEITPTSRFAVVTWAALAMACCTAAATTLAIPFLGVGQEDNRRLYVESVQTDETLNLTVKQDDAPVDTTTRSLQELAASVPEPHKPVTTTLTVSSPLLVDAVVVGNIQKSNNDDDVKKSVIEPIPVDEAAATSSQFVMTANIMLPRSRTAASIQLDGLKRRAPALFLEKSMKLDEAGQVLTIGPFETPQQTVQFCRTVKLRLTLDCTSG